MQSPFIPGVRSGSEGAWFNVVAVAHLDPVMRALAFCDLPCGGPVAMAVNATNAIQPSGSAG